MCTSGNKRRRSFIEPMDISQLDLDGESPPSQSKSRASPTKTDPDFNADNKTQEKCCVQHDYHDHALDIENEDVEQSAVSRGGVTVPFPLKLHRMMEFIDASEPDLADIMSWQPHGRCFLVHKPKDFAAKVLPRFFHQKKYASFQRQLNLYGFNRITKGPDSGSYYHELFLRGKQFLSRGIQRMKIKGTGARMASNPDAEPNFYTMSSVCPPTNRTTTTTIPAHESSSEATSSIALPMNIISSSTSIPMTCTSQGNPKLFDGYMPRNQSSNYNSQRQMPAAIENSEDSNFDYVFDNMPFHSIRKSGNRRNSLIDISQRRSFLSHSRRNSLISPSLEIELQREQSDDEDFFMEMRLISKLGEKTLTDEDLGLILEQL